MFAFSFYFLVSASRFAARVAGAAFFGLFVALLAAAWALTENEERKQRLEYLIARCFGVAPEGEPDHRRKTQPTKAVLDEREQRLEARRNWIARRDKALSRMQYGVYVRHLGAYYDYVKSR